MVFSSDCHKLSGVWIEVIITPENLNQGLRIDLREHAGVHSSKRLQAEAEAVLS
jgi:hypothetical protein